MKKNNTIRFIYCTITSSGSELYEHLFGWANFLQKDEPPTWWKHLKQQASLYPAGGDTIFYSFSTIRDTAADCKDTTKGSIFGRKVYRHNTDLMFLFFNKRNDTIFVNAKAILNETWKFVNLNITTFLEAKLYLSGRIRWWMFSMKWWRLNLLQTAGR